MYKGLINPLANECRKKLKEAKKKVYDIRHEIESNEHNCRVNEIPFFVSDIQKVKEFEIYAEFNFFDGKQWINFFIA